MKKENLVLIALTLFTTIATGCGRNYAGTYTGTEIISLSSVSATGTTATTGSAPAIPTTATMTLTINQSSGTLLTGTWNSQGQTGTFQGTAGGDSITGITLTMMGTPTNTNMQGAYGYGQTTSYNPALQMGMCNSFTGNLTLTPNNQIMGSLTVVRPAQPAVTATQQNYGSPQNYGNNVACAGTRSVTANKMN